MQCLPFRKVERVRGDPELDERSTSLVNRPHAKTAKADCLLTASTFCRKTVRASPFQVLVLRLLCLKKFLIALYMYWLFFSDPHRCCVLVLTRARCWSAIIRALST